MRWGNDVLGACPSNPSLRGKGDAGRCEAAGAKKPEAYSLEYVEGFFGAENDPDGCRSFAAAEWYYSDRLLAHSFLRSVAHSTYAHMLPFFWVMVTVPDQRQMTHLERKAQRDRQPGDDIPLLVLRVSPVD